MSTRNDPQAKTVDVRTPRRKLELLRREVDPHRYLLGRC